MNESGSNTNLQLRHQIKLNFIVVHQRSLHIPAANNFFFNPDCSDLFKEGDQSIDVTHIFLPSV